MSRYFNYGDKEPVRWLTPDTLLMKYSTSFVIESSSHGDKDFEGIAEGILGFGKNHEAKLEKLARKKSSVSAFR